MNENKTTTTPKAKSVTTYHEVKIGKTLYGDGITGGYLYPAKLRGLIFRSFSFLYYPVCPLPVNIDIRWFLRVVLSRLLQCLRRFCLPCRDKFALSTFVFGSIPKLLLLVTPKSLHWSLVYRIHLFFN